MTSFLLRHGESGDAVRRGEVWWGSPSIPGQTRKRRPFLVVSDDAFNANVAYAKVLVVHLTTVQRSKGPYAWEVSVSRGTGALPKGSLAKCAEVYTVFREDLADRIGMLPNQTMKQVDRALSLTLGLTRLTSVGRPPG
jgi:mRNA interferase MazF